MKKGKFQNAASAGRTGRKLLALILSVVLCVGIGIGGTIAWLTAQSEVVENTFSPSTISIELTETPREYQMIPGWTIDKDPVVTVKAESEDCWVFIKVEETKNLSDYIAYSIDTNNWTKLENADVGPSEAVYYTKYAKRDDVDINLKILAGGSHTYDGVEYTWNPEQVLTKPEVTKQMMDSVTADVQPRLIFTAYASQYWRDNNIPFTAYEAWENCPKGTD